MPDLGKRDIWISIHALLAESDLANCTKIYAFGISIHALLAESDYYRNPHHDRFQISIHALLAESDLLLRL